jgi:hypothetical protein
MIIELNLFGETPIKPAQFIEIVVEADGEKLKTIISSNGLVDKDLIKKLRRIADDLEYQNKLQQVYNFMNNEQNNGKRNT